MLSPTFLGIPILSLAVLFFLLVISIIDLKLKQVPAVLTSAIIFILLIVNPSNLIYGIVAAMFGVLLLELGEIGGLADLKALAIIGLMISSLPQLLLFLMLVVGVGLFYKVFMKFVLKKKEEIAFVPVYFITYLIIVIVQVI